MYTEEQLRAAFIAGFLGSTKQWNSEFPFRVAALDPNNNRVLNMNFESFRDKLLAKAGSLSPHEKLDGARTVMR